MLERGRSPWWSDKRLIVSRAPRGLCVFRVCSFGGMTVQVLWPPCQGYYATGHSGWSGVK